MGHSLKDGIYGVKIRHGFLISFSMGGRWKPRGMKTDDGQQLPNGKAAQLIFLADKKYVGKFCHVEKLKIE